MCVSKTTSQQDTSSSYSPPPQVMAEYQDVVNKAQGVAATPYQSYNGELVAGINPQQTSGINAVNAASGIQDPYNTGAGSLTAASAGAIDPTQYSAAQLQQYESPYLSDVIKATEAQIQNQNAQQAANLTSGAIGSGAFGGDRAGIAQAALAGQQDIASNATLANLYNQNFEQAQGEFNTQQSVDLAAAQNTAARQLAAGAQLGQLGQTAQGEALNEANAQTNAGTLEQTTKQAQDTAAYNQFLQRQAYPFETTGWLANIIEGIGSQSGGSSTGTTTTQGNSGSQIAGGLLGLASFLARGGRVPHRADGGEIYIPQLFDPTAGGPVGIGGGGIVPTGHPLSVGHTMPTQGAPSGSAAPSAAQQGQSMAQTAKAVQSAGKGLGNAFTNSPLGDAWNDAQQDATIPISEGGTLDDGVLAGGTELGLGGIGMMACGGIVDRRRHYAIGGAPAGFQLNGAPRPGPVAAPGAIQQAPVQAAAPGTAAPGAIAASPPMQGGSVAAPAPAPTGMSPGISGAPPTQPIAPPASGGIAPGPISGGPLAGPTPAPVGVGSLNYGTPPAQASMQAPAPSPFSVGSLNYGAPPAGLTSNSFWQPASADKPAFTPGQQNFGAPPPQSRGIGNPSFFARGGIVGRPHYDDGGLVPSGDPMFDLSPESLLLNTTAPTAPVNAEAIYANQMPAPSGGASGLSPDAVAALRAADAPRAPGSATSNVSPVSPSAPFTAADIQVPRAISNGALGSADASVVPADVPLPPPRPSDLGASPPVSAPPAGIAPARVAPFMAAPTYAGPAPSQIDPTQYPNTQAGHEAFIRDYAAKRGVDPDFAVSVARAEGLGALSPKNPNGASAVDIDPETGKPFSFGDYQLNVRNGLGNLAMASGIDPKDPSQWQAADKFALDYMAKNGLQPWRGDKAVQAYAAKNGEHALAYDGGPSSINAPAVKAIEAHVSPPGGIAPASSTQTSLPQFPDSVPTPESGRTGLFGLNLSPETRQLMLSAGLGIMGTNGRSFLGNVGQGALTGIAAARQNANTASEIGLRQAQTQGAQIENQLKAQQLKLMLDALSGHADSIASAANGAPSLTTPTVTAGAAGQGAGQKQVDPNFDPVALRALADRLSMAGPMFKDRADRAAAQAAAIMSGDQQVRFTDGTTGYYPGVGEAKAAQSSAITAANEQAKVPAAQAQKDIETAHNDSTQAQTALYRLQEMNEQVKNLPTKGFLAPGAYAGERGNLARGLNTISSIFGGEPIADPNNVAALEELSKDKFRLGAELSRQIGGKEPGFIVQSAVTANPGAENSAVGYRRIVNGLTQAMLYRNDHASFVPDYYKKNGNTTDVETAFQKSHPISMYVERALTSAVDPRDAIALKQAGKDPEAAAIFDKKYGKGVAALLAKRGYDVSDGLSP